MTRSGQWNSRRGGVVALDVCYFNPPSRATLIPDSEADHSGVCDKMSYDHRRFWPVLFNCHYPGKLRIWHLIHTLQSYPLPSSENLRTILDSIGSNLVSSNTAYRARGDYRMAKYRKLSMTIIFTAREFYIFSGPRAERSIRAIAQLLGLKSSLI